ncbi:hypothetical protein [Halomicrobium salinisoli]|uniref:hypothetical protein n=1 Tax=Halomicrobium salinisoli TaxID=2878391 RepID=UPI001CF0C06B|nr:hypothetical protein [Halomicrobium salinisoli]
MDRGELLDRLSEDVLAYVMHGSFPEEHLAREIKPDALDERFYDYEMLVRLHFILDPDVVSFVESLPDHLRSIKTQTKRTSAVSKGGVDGRINWSETIKERYARNPNDGSLFVCDDRSEHYDVDENVVLKRLLSIIYGTIEECEEYLKRDYEWVTDSWKESGDLVETMRRVFERNVHVTRIREPAAYEPTPRMLQRASESRSELYRTASRLLDRYRRTRDGDPDAIRDLLNETAITPDDDETLFELYVLFRYVEAIERTSDERFTLRTIESGSQEVARLADDDAEIVLYHDNSARDRGLSFRSDVREKDPDELSRTEFVEREAEELTEEYFLDRSVEQHTGRPDVIVLEVSSGETTEYLITEVKYSHRPETVQRGIRETLEYLAFLRDDGDLVHEDSEYFGSGWNGVLVIQDVEDSATAPLEDQRSIRIVQASELEEKLTEILERVV